jgi:hypothetical protein
MKPSGSSASSSASHRVGGSAPISTIIPAASSARRAPVSASSTMTSLEVAVAFQGPHLMREEDVDGRIAADPFAQVAGHALLEPRATHDDEDVVSLLGERERRVAGRVRAADDDRASARRELLARDVDRVGHARALVVLDAGHRQAAIAHAEREDHAARDQLVAAFDREDVPALALTQADRPRGHHHVGAELRDLHLRALGQLGPGDAGGKAQVVLDPSRGRGLAPDAPLRAGAGGVGANGAAAGPMVGGGRGCGGGGGHGLLGVVGCGHGAVDGPGGRASRTPCGRFCARPAGSNSNSPAGWGPAWVGASTAWSLRDATP